VHSSLAVTAGYHLPTARTVKARAPVRSVATVHSIWLPADWLTFTCNILLLNVMVTARGDNVGLACRQRAAAAL